MSERDPLLHGQPEQGDGVEALPPKDPRRLGPLEISRSTRYGILAGLWTATFLSVSSPDVLCFISYEFVQALNRDYILPATFLSKALLIDLFFEKRDSCPY